MTPAQLHGVVAALSVTLGHLVQETEIGRHVGVSSPSDEMFWMTTRARFAATRAVAVFEAAAVAPDEVVAVALELRGTIVDASTLLARLRQRLSMWTTARRGAMLN